MLLCLYDGNLKLELSHFYKQLPGIGGPAFFTVVKQNKNR